MDSWRFVWNWVDGARFHSFLWMRPISISMGAMALRRSLGTCLDLGFAERRSRVYMVKMGTKKGVDHIVG